MIIHDKDGKTSASIVGGALTIRATDALPVYTEETAPTDAAKLNPSYTFSNADETVVTTTVATMIIGDVSYTRSLTYNAAGDLLGITAWTEVEGQ